MILPENLRKKSDNRIKLCLLLLAVLLIVSAGIEILGFNFRVLTLPKEQKGEYEVSVGDLKVKDLLYNKKSNNYMITGEDPLFSIEEVDYIKYLEVELAETSSPVHINLNQTGKSYDLNPDIKKTSILNIEDSTDGLELRVSTDDGSNSFKINQIIVNNTVTFNWLRVLLIFSIGSIIIFLALFYDIMLKNLHIAFLVIALIVGINMSLMTPTYYTFDELQHFIRAYELANFDLGIFRGKEIAWIENIDDFFYFSGNTNVTHNTYPEFVDYFNNYATNQYTHEAYYESTAVTYPFIPYFFSGVGILTARLIRLPFIVSFYMGRIFSLLGYVSICYLAIKYAKLGKRIMFLIALFPVSVYSAAAYSADPLTLSFSLLSITLFTSMLCADKETVDYSRPILFALCVSMMTMCKITYAPFCLLILSVPYIKFKSKKQALFCKAGVFAIVGIVAILTLLFGALKGINQWGMPGVDTSDQVIYILNNIFKYIHIMLSHVTKNVFGYFTGTISYLAYCGELNTIWSVGMIVFLFIMALLDNENKDMYIQIRGKIILMIVTLASWALVLTALYISFTPVGKPEIDGVQGRYFAPLLLPVLLLFQTGKIRCDYTKEQLNLLTVSSSFFLLLVSVITIFSAYCA